jgi:hypothetical protein
MIVWSRLLTDQVLINGLIVMWILTENQMTTRRLHETWLVELCLHSGSGLLASKLTAEHRAE